MPNKQQASNAILDVLGRIAQAVSAGVDLPALLNIIEQQTQRVIDSDCFCIARYDPQEEALHFDLIYDRGVYLPTIVLRKADGWGLPGRLIEEGAPLRFSDLSAADVSQSPLPLSEPPRSWLGAPLIIRDEPIGIVLALSYTAEAFGPGEQRLLEAIATQSAVAIEDLDHHEEHERRFAQLAVLTEISRALTSALELDELLNTVYQQVGRLFDTTNFHIGTYQEEHDSWTLVFCRERGEPHPQTGHDFPAEAGLTGYILHHEHPILLRSAEETYAFHQRHDIALVGDMAQSWMGVPLIAADKIVGVMAVQSYTDEALYDEGDLALFSTIGAQVAVALENARLYQEARQRAEEMGTLFTVSQVLAAHTELEKTWTAIFEAVRQVVPYNGIEVCLYDPQRNALRAVVAGTGVQLAPTEEEEIYALGEGYTGWIGQYRQPLLVDDVREEQRAKPKFDQVEGTELRSYLGVPMILSDRLVGTLEILHFEPGMYGAHHQDLLLNVAAQAAAAVDRARLFEQLRLRAEEQQILNELGQALSARLNVEQVLDEAYQQASRLLDTTNLYVALYDPEINEITFALDVTEGEVRRPYTKRKAGHGLTEHVIHRRAPVLIQEDLPEALEQIGVELIGPVAESWLGVPLMIGDRVLGVIAVQSYTTPHLYDEHDRDLLTAISTHAAIAIENAHLFEETQRALEEVRAANERQRELLDTVRELSTPLMPVAEDVLVLPLIGTIDTRRAEQIMEVLLEGVTRHRARVVIVDITGVPVVDTNVANYLLQATQALRLVGAESVLVGITSDVAQTMVGLGLDLRILVTRSDLRGGMEYARELLSGE